MGSETIAFDILLVFLCLNGGLLIVGTAFPDTILRTPFDTSLEVTGIRTGLPSQIYNSTTGTGIAQNLTSATESNSTIGGTGVSNLNPIETIFFPLSLLWSFIQFVTNLVPLFNMMSTFGMPDMFIYTIVGVIGILIARMVVYFVWGR